MYPCDVCTQVFTLRSNMVRHKVEEHLHLAQKHYIQTHGPHINCTTALPLKTDNYITRYISESSFNNQVRIIRFITKLHLLPEIFFIHASSLIEETLQLLLDERHPLKIQCSLAVTFEKGDTTDESYFSTKAHPICIMDMNQVMESIQAQIENFTKRGSAWTLSKTNFFQMNVTKYACI